VNFPDGLAFDRNDNLYAANVNTNTVEKFTPAAVRSTFAPIAFTPIGLAFDTAGNLFVSDGQNHIRKVPPAGGSSTDFAGPHSGVGGLAFDTPGNLYAAVAFENSILKYTPAESTFVNGGGLWSFLAFTDDNGVPLPLPNQVPEPLSLTLLVPALAAAIFARRPSRA
jgi:sugar lactone lactonase YvrE